MKREAVPLILAVTMLLLTTTPTTVVSDTIKPYSGISPLIRHEMTINIVLINLPEVDAELLVWNLEKTIQPEVQVPAQPLYSTGISYGVEFRLDYKIVRASQDFTEALKSRLALSKKPQRVPKYLAQSFTEEDKATYDIIDASATENWLAEHAADFGGIPKNGYSLLLADMSAFSRSYHYYEMRYDSKDPVSYKAKYLKTEWTFPVVNWMIGWGGHYRFYYVDLSAGSVERDYSFTGHIPIQEFGIKRVSGFGPRSIKEFRRSSETVTNYVADYVVEAVRNLFVPSYVYYPTLSRKYSVQVSLFSEIDGLSTDNYVELLDADVVKSAFKELIPSASWDVRIVFRYLKDDVGMKNVFDSSKIFEHVREVYDKEKVLFRYFDERIIYSYIQQRLATYVDKKDDTVILPVFIFVVSQGGSIVTSWKNDVRGGFNVVVDPDRFPRTFGASSYGDMVIGILSERNIYAWGIGLTNLVIHELGHSVGLMHPFSYGSTQDYVSSAMSYSTHEYGFSQFDKDALARGHADQALRNVMDIFSKMPEVSFKSSEAASIAKAARAELEKGLAEYNILSYANALESFAKIPKMIESLGQVMRNRIAALGSPETDIAKLALERARITLETATQLVAKGSYAEAYAQLVVTDELIEQTQSMEQARRELEQAKLMFLVVGIALGIAVGFVVVKITAGRKRARPMPAPSPAPPKKYCVECGRELQAFAVYCGGCGTRQSMEEMK